MFALFKRNSEKARLRAQGEAIYRALFRGARNPVFYQNYAVPDTLDGRFGLLCLHVFCFIHSMRNSADNFDYKDKIIQSVFDVMFQGMDISLREAGVGDLGVPRRVKQMMEAFHGACHAYQAAGEDEAVLAFAIFRNVYGGVGAAEGAARLARYVQALISALSEVNFVQVSGEGGPVLSLPDPEVVL